MRKTPGKCSRGTGSKPQTVLADLNNRKHPSRSLNSRRRLRETPPFTTTQFHVLLNSLFKVLFNFPSRYLFAIGLGVIFSLTRSLPRTLSCTPKQLDSGKQPMAHCCQPYGPITLHGLWPQSRWTWASCNATWMLLPNTTFRATKGGRFGDGLCPFHSPLLRASQLFSFPPLINMLKFGG